MTLLELLAVFIAACGVSMAIIAPVRRLAERRSVLDLPDDGRHAHKRPVPRLGGLAVFAGFVVAVTGAVLYEWMNAGTEPASLVHTAQMLLACAILLGIGLADDVRGVPPVVKVTGQVAAALVVQYHWSLLSVVHFPPHLTISLGWLGVPIMTLWLVGVSNALNLVDGLDGLAGGVSLIALLTIVATSFALSNGASPIACVALAGAVLGFLRYNFPPATIFLGDSGSLVVGFLLAFFSVRRATRPDGIVLAVIPIFALAYPLLDTGTSMLRRWLRGHPLSRADGRHIHHQLVALGLSDRKALGVICAFATGIATLGLSMAFAPPAFTVAVMVGSWAVVLVMLACGVHWLQYHEFIDAGVILGSAGSLAKRAIRDAIHSRDVAKLIDNAKTLQEIDTILGQQSATFRFACMQVGSCDARLPYELSHSTTSLWKLEYPIVVTAGGGFRTSGGLEGSLVLAIWCPKDSTVRSASAERVARVLADAIAGWSNRVSEAIGTEIRVRAGTSSHRLLPIGGLAVLSDPFRGGEHGQTSLEH